MAENTGRFLIKILAASTSMIDFFCTSMTASNFWDDKKSTPGNFEDDKMLSCISMNANNESEKPALNLF